jgi:DNA mismatch repair protein MutH
LATTTFAKAPLTEEELIINANSLTGRSLQQIASELGLQVPSDQKHAKGWVGEMIEIYLGATASSLPEPDFQHIGVELKTLPLDHRGKPKETTYVCTVSLHGVIGDSWDNSVVKRKLNRVLWVPIEADPSILLSKRRIGNPFIWSPSNKQETVLRIDWEEHMDMIAMGEVNKLSSRQGKYLQIRPKAANASALSQTNMENGEIGMTLPRGFYLRTNFTQILLNEQ